MITVRNSLTFHTSKTTLSKFGHLDRKP